MKVKRKLLVYPNSGEIWDAVKKEFISCSSVFLTDQKFSEEAITWYKLGAEMIGGCCQIRPPCITKIRQKLTEFVN